MYLCILQSTFLKSWKAWSNVVVSCSAGRLIYIYYLRFEKLIFILKIWIALSDVGLECRAAVLTIWLILPSWILPVRLFSTVFSNVFKCFQVFSLLCLTKNKNKKRWSTKTRKKNGKIDLIKHSLPYAINISSRKVAKQNRENE